MKHIFLLLAAALSIAGSASGATRPRFGGTLRVEVRGALTSFDLTPDRRADVAFLQDSILTSVCDRLITLDTAGEPRASLATAWRTERDGRSWHLTLRNGVALHNGSTLNQQQIVTALSAANPNWRVRIEARELLVQSDAPLADLPYQLAEPRNSICLAADRGQWIGSGPFQISEFKSGQYLELKAFDEAWQGRPFLDRIRFEMGKPLAEQASDFQLGRADLIETDRTQQRPPNGSSTATQPVQLIALVFWPGRPASSGLRLREAIARAIDRNSIVSVLLRRQGEPTAALTPEWISGYAHLFSTTQDLALARQLGARRDLLAPLSIGYDLNDPLAKLIAERISVNAREAGIALEPVPQTIGNRSPNQDATVMRLRIASPNPATAISAIGAALNMQSLEKAPATNSLDGLYAIEGDALNDFSIVPVAHVPEELMLGPTVRDWSQTRWGEINFGNLWLEISR